MKKSLLEKAMLTNMTQILIPVDVFSHKYRINHFKNNVIKGWGILTK